MFSDEDKLYWCYECTRNILNECPEYGTHAEDVVTDEMVIPLPLGVGLMDVARLYVNGVRVPITNATDYNDYTFRKGDKVVMVYRKYPGEYQLEGGAVPEDVETVCGAPFESMYIDYVCAQVAFQQNDADEYNKFIGAFNDKLYSYKMFYGSNAPASAPMQSGDWF